MTGNGGMTGASPVTTILLNATMWLVPVMSPIDYLNALFITNIRFAGRSAMRRMR